MVLKLSVVVFRVSTVCMDSSKHNRRALRNAHAGKLHTTEATVISSWYVDRQVVSSTTRLKHGEKIPTPKQRHAAILNHVPARQLQRLPPKAAAVEPQAGRCMRDAIAPPPRRIQPALGVVSSLTRGWCGSQ